MCEAMDVVKLTELLQQGLEDDAWRLQAITAGLVHASAFSWQRCADETLQVYQKVMDS